MRQKVSIVISCMAALFVFQCERVGLLDGHFVGVVTDEVSQDSISNVTITFKNAGRIVATTNSQEDGRFSTNIIPLLDYQIILFKEGYVPDSSQTATLSGAMTEISLFLKPLAAITGVVSNHENSALDGVQLVISGTDAFNESRTTNELGEYSFVGLEDGAYDLTAKKQGYVTLIEKVTVEAGAPTHLDLRLNSLACIHGLVNTSLGEPVEKAFVSLWLGESNLESKVSNDQGVFNFEGLEEGTYRLEFSKQGFIAREAVLEVSEGDSTPFVQVLDETPFIQGSVTAANNEALEGVRITLSGENIPDPIAFTDAQGNYYFEGLDFETYSLHFEKESFKSASRSLSLKQDGSHNPVNQVLETETAIFGTAVDLETNRLLPKVTVKLLAMGNEIQATETDSLGRFSFKELEEGTYQIQAISSGYAHPPVSIDLVEGNRIQTVLLLQRLATQLAVSDSLLNFGSDQTILPLEIQNTGDGELNWEIISDIEGLSINPSAGSTSPSVTSSVNLVLNRRNIRHGSYSKTITIQTQKAGSKLVNIDFEVQGKLCIRPSSLNFEDHSVKKIEINNCGDGVIEYLAKTENEWMQVLSSSGFLSSEADSIAIRIDRENIAPGNYRGQLNISFLGGAVNVPVRMTVNEPEKPQLSLSASTLDFGRDQTNMIIQVSNSGGEKLSWESSTEQEWIEILPNAGVLESGEAISVEIEVFRGELAQDEVTIGKIKFSSEEGGEAEVDVIVSTLETPKLDISTDFMDFGVFGELFSFRITKTGNGSLSWTLTPSNTWMTVSPESGVNNQEIMVRIDRDQVEEDGEYNGHIQVSASDSSTHTINIRMNKRSSLPDLSASLKIIEVPIDSIVDRALSPGNKAYLGIKVTNAQGTEVDFAGVVGASIFTHSPYLTIPADSVKAFGDLRPGESSTQIYSLDVEPNAPINEPVEIKVAHWADGGYSTASYLQANIRPALSSGLTGYFDFNSGEAVDLVRGSFASNSGARSSEDKPGQWGLSMQFDKISEDFISMKDNPIGNYNTEATFNLWIKSVQTSGFKSLLYASRSDDEADLLSIDENNMVIAAGLTFDLDIADQLLDGGWHMLTVVLGQSHNELYIDRSQVFRNAGSHLLKELGELQDGATMGRRGRNGTGLYDGYIDNVRFYNRALSEQEINALFIAEGNR